MKIFNQLIIIFLIWGVGEIISEILPFPMPGSVIGMLILLILLLTKILKLDSIDEVSSFMLKNMGIFFIPPGVGVLVSYKLLKGSSLGFFLVCFLTTFLVMAVSGLTVDFLLSKRGGEND